MRSKLTLVVILNFLCVMDFYQRVLSEKHVVEHKNDELNARTAVRVASFQKRQTQAEDDSEVESEVVYDRSLNEGGGDKEEYEINEESVTSFDESHTTVKRSAFEDLYVSKPDDAKKSNDPDDIYESWSELSEEEPKSWRKADSGKASEKSFGMGEPTLYDDTSSKLDSVASPKLTTTINVDTKKQGDVKEDSNFFGPKKTTDVAERNTNKNLGKSVGNKSNSDRASGGSKIATPKGRSKSNTPSSKRQRLTTAKNEMMKLSVHRPQSSQSSKEKSKTSIKDRKRVWNNPEANDDVVVEKTGSDRLETDQEEKTSEVQEDANKIGAERTKVVEAEGETPADFVTQNVVIADEKTLSEKMGSQDTAPAEDPDSERTGDITEERAVLEQESEASKKSKVKDRERGGEREKDKVDYELEKHEVEESEAEVLEKKRKEKLRSQLEETDAESSVNKEDDKLIKENKWTAEGKLKKPERKNEKSDAEIVKVSEPRETGEQVDTVVKSEPDERKITSGNVEEEEPSEEKLPDWPKSSRKKSNLSNVTRIWGGDQISNTSECPYTTMLVIRMGTELTYICTAAILSEEWVISCAHCFYIDGELVVVSRIMFVAGQMKTDINDLNKTAQIRVVEEVHIHPGYKEQTFDSITHDIGLAKMREPFVFNMYIDKIVIRALPLPRLYSETGPARKSTFPIKAHSYGWGRSDELNNLNVTLRSLRFKSCPCLYWWHERFLFCAQRTFDDANICKGDYGGPLVFRQQLIGIAQGIRSWSCERAYIWDDNDCEDVNKYAIYINLCVFLEWIGQHVPKTPAQPDICYQSMSSSVIPHPLFFQLFILFAIQHFI